MSKSLVPDRQSVRDFEYRVQIRLDRQFDQHRVSIQTSANTRIKGYER